MPSREYRIMFKKCFGQVKRRATGWCRTGDNNSKFAKSKVAVRLSALFNLSNNLSHTFLRSSSPPPLQPPTTSKPFTMPPRTTAPSQIKTRAKNKDSHPGVPDQAQPRRTSVEVENERAAKAQKKVAEQEKKRQNI